VGFPNTPSFDMARPVSHHADTLARVHPAVLAVESYSSSYGDLRRADGVAVPLMISVIDTQPDAMAFARLLSPRQRALLDELDALIIDEADLGKLDAKIGAVLEVNGKRARIVDVVQGLRSIGGVSVVASFATARRFDPTVRIEQPLYFMLRLAPGADVQQVAREITDPGAAPRWSVRVAEEFSVDSQLYWLFESGAGVGAGFGALLAMAVGVVITSQTLAAAILASLKEFAALRALGVSRSALRGVVLELSAWIGGLGLLLTAALSAGIAWLADANQVAMVFSPLALGGTAGVIVVITTLSGLYALRPLFQADPASLLR
jgi:putative ABC transport system permease protein